MRVMQDAHAPRPPAQADRHAVIVIGSGFGGIGMAVALKRAGIHDFVILERAQDVGGVWRDNAYPGAACDVPSHLYSFSFDPNPAWTRVFASQPEIHAYLQDCARRHALMAHIQFGAEVAQAAFDEGTDSWRVTLRDGRELSARILVSATGQLSQPASPALPGLARFQGKAFHSAHWDHSHALAGRRVAVVGTGASAIQFVPVIAPQVASLSVFQRSPAYILPRPDRAYSALERGLFQRVPLAMAAHRAWIYLKYESRALAFTRLKGLMDIAAGRPFQKLLRRQVASPELRARLTPDYPVGCKRILLSSEYLATLSRPNVDLVTEGIRRVTETGIETTDGRHHEVDTIVFGTGFAATSFLSPMTILGCQGRDLNTAWQDGAMAYLGLSVPGFPNFFMLYGPNTNLGHNSIVYMLESQIAHVMRCLRALDGQGMDRIEVDAQAYSRFNVGIQKRLAQTVWSGCKSWYVDAQGHNSTNWPGFTLTYRALVQHGSLQPYTLSRAAEARDGAQGRVLAQPSGGWASLAHHLVRGLLRVAFQPLIGPPFAPRWQRAVARALSAGMPAVAARRTQVAATSACPPLEVVHPDVPASHGAILYLHGGAFCLGSPATHRSLTTRLAQATGMAVHVPDYRLAPEHPFPAGIDDVWQAYQHLLRSGHAPHQIVVAGDSAGGMLALSLALRLRAAGQPSPVALLLLSPLTDPSFSGDSLRTRRQADPMLREGWLRQAASWYQCLPGQPDHTPLRASLAGLPPMCVQVGLDEILLDDAVRLAAQAQAQGVPCELEIHEGGWHVFPLQAFFLPGSRHAIGRLAAFAVAAVTGAAPQTRGGSEGAMLAHNPASRQDGAPPRGARTA